MLQTSLRLSFRLSIVAIVHFGISRNIPAPCYSRTGELVPDSQRKDWVPVEVKHYNYRFTSARIRSRQFWYNPAR